MPIDKAIITLIGMVGIITTYWFFFVKKEEMAVVKDSQDILVEGGFKPAKIIIPQGKPVQINLLRKDANPCLEEVVIPEFKIRKFLPLDEKVTISFTPLKKGEFPFSCAMNMFHGKIKVV